MPPPVEPKPGPKRRVWNLATGAAGLVIGSIALFLYVWLRLMPAAEQYSVGPLFFFGRPFFAPFATRPGGLSEYAAACLAQLSHFSWAGGLVFACEGALLAIVGQRLLHRFSGIRIRVLGWAPVFLLLILRERAYAASLTLGPALLVSYTALLVYFALDRKHTETDASPAEQQSLSLGHDRISSAKPRVWDNLWLRFIVGAILAAATFYIAGIWACALFGVTASLFETLKKKKWRGGLTVLVAALPGPVWLLAFSSMGWSQMAASFGTGLQLVLIWSLYLFVPLAAVALVVFDQKPQVQKTSPARHPPPKKSARRPGPGAPSLSHVSGAALILLGAAMVWAAFDAERNALQRIEFYGDHKQYEQVLAVASKLQRLDPPGEVRLQLALYHTGRLGEDLFAFRNQTVWDILPSLGYGAEACRPQSQMLLELGQLGEAEHMAHEALEWEGDRADILKVLAAVNILKNRPEAARIFLSVLAQVPFEGTWAKACLIRLRTDPQLEQEPDWAPIRARLVSTDMPHNDVAAASLFRQLLRANPRNQMAFEYLMAHYLLTLQLDQFIDHFKGLGAFDYARIPRHYEEAILLFQKLKRASVDLGGRAIRPETQARFQRLSEALDRGAGKTEEGRVALGREFGDTFWYYYIARQTDSRTQPKAATNKYE